MLRHLDQPLLKFYRKAAITKLIVNAQRKQNTFVLDGRLKSVQYRYNSDQPGTPASVLILSHCRTALYGGPKKDCV